MRTLAAGPSGRLLPDQEYDLHPTQAKALVDGGYAALVTPLPAGLFDVPEPPSLEEAQEADLDSCLGCFSAACHPGPGLADEGFEHSKRLQQIAADNNIPVE